MSAGVHRRIGLRLVCTLSLTAWASVTPARADSEPIAPVQSAPVQVDLSCPKGAERQGHPPPRGFVVSCHLNQGGRLLPHGRTVRWHDNGRLMETVEYRKGELNGEWSRWDEQGRLLSRVEYLGGQMHGTKAEYFPDGKTKKEIHYRGGELHGSWKVWNENGDLVTSREYENGRITAIGGDSGTEASVPNDEPPAVRGPEPAHGAAAAGKTGLPEGDSNASRKSAADPDLPRPIQCSVGSKLYKDAYGEVRDMADAAGVPVEIILRSPTVVVDFGESGTSVDARIEGRPASVELKAGMFEVNKYKGPWEELRPSLQARLDRAHEQASKLALASLKNVGIYLSERKPGLKSREIDAGGGIRLVFGAFEMQSVGRVRLPAQVSLKLVPSLDFQAETPIAARSAREELILFSDCVELRKGTAAEALRF